MEKKTQELTIRVDSNLALHAGWWEECTERDGSKSRMVYPHEYTLFEQVLRYLEAISAQSPWSSEARISLDEEVRAMLAVCLRWGSYFAVLVDEAKPVWPRASRQRASLVADAEMARINIEASAAAEQWIDIMRSDYERYCLLVRAARQLPMPLKSIQAIPRKRERLLEWAFFSECIHSLQLDRDPISWRRKNEPSCHLD